MLKKMYVVENGRKREATKEEAEKYEAEKGELLKHIAKFQDDNRGMLFGFFSGDQCPFCGKQF